MARWDKLPAWTIETWLNEPVDWACLDGVPLMVLFFHLRCDGCIHLALPQAEAMHREFGARGVRVAAIHCDLYGGHSADLEAFLKDRAYSLPVGLDAAAPDNWKPSTMTAWAIEGTPTFVLLDKRRQLRMKRLGHMDDQRLAAALEQLLSE